MPREKHVKPDVTRASAEELRANRSRVATVRRELGSDLPLTVELDDSRPVSLMDRPLEVVPHEEIPDKLREAIVGIYGEEFFYNQRWTRVQLKKLQRAIHYPRENSAVGIVQVCSTRCSMRDVCPYDISGKPPLGDRCPIELCKADLIYEKYVEAISERLNIDPGEVKDDIILNNFIMGLVETDLVDERLNHRIAQDGFDVSVPTLVNSETGQVYYRDEIAVAIRIKEGIDRKKASIFKALLATPEMAAKYRNRSHSDPMARHSEVIDQLEMRLKELEATIDSNKIALKEIDEPES